MHGMVLKTSDVDYSDLLEYGRVVIERTSAGVTVTVDGFEFSKADSCRMHVAKGAAWARDILASAVASTRLIPGGEIVLASGLSQGDLEAAAERKERR